MTKTTSKQSVEEWLDSLDPSTMVVRDGRHMREIWAARTALEAAETRLHDAVADAIAAGDSWGMIGVALGTSRQAAHRKFARLVRPAEVGSTRSGDRELPD